MDTSSFTCFTPEVNRLTSFQRTPLPNQHKLGVSNCPAKFAKAGFMRREDAINDEVSCEYRRIVYDEWRGESPYTVHWVLNEHCPFLTTPSPSTPIQNDPRLQAARRRLFPADVDADDTIQSIDNVFTTSSMSDGDVESVVSDAESVSDDPQSDHSGTIDSHSDTESSESENETESQSESVLNTDPTVPVYASVLLNPRSDFGFPFHPKVGGCGLLFASRRLKTFSDPGCPEFVELAEEGFVYRPDTRDVQCVFCGLVLPFHTCEPKQAHAENSKFCPRVLFKDVGNISTAEEERIRRKNLQRQLRNKSVFRSFAVCHPQFEDESVRTGTFENWPHNSWDESLGATSLSYAGFFFTGLADKVRCFTCGLGVLKWHQGADPWVQHALHMPTCPHLLVKGQHFIQQAAQAQALTEAEIPPSASSCSSASPGLTGQVVTSPPGSLTLDMSAVTAALSTSRYPTKDILLGTLRAADENFTALCQQRDVIHQKDTELHQKDTELHQKDTELHQKDTELHQKDTELHQKDTVIQQTHTELQQTHTELQQTHTELQHRDEVLQHKDEELQHKDEELQHKDEELQQQREETQKHLEELERKTQEVERKTQQMRYQEMQIEALKIQMKALLAERNQDDQQAAALRAAAAPAPQDDKDGSDDSMMCDIRCKVCLSEESNTILKPCHHITCCNTCAMEFTCCPVCRAPIKDVRPAFIA